MPIIAYKTEINVKGYAENICVAFNCEYDQNKLLKLKDYEPNNFDSGDFRIKIGEISEKLSQDVLKQYENKNDGVRFLAILNYFIDNIPSLYSIKFESNSGISIYYASEIKNK